MGMCGYVVCLFVFYVVACLCVVCLLCVRFYKSFCICYKVHKVGEVFLGGARVNCNNCDKFQCISLITVAMQVISSGLFFGTCKIVPSSGETLFLIIYGNVV